MNKLEKDSGQWTKSILEELAHKTRNYSPREKLNIKTVYLQRVFEKVPQHISEDDWEEFSSKSKELLDQLPEKQEGKPLAYRNYLKTLSKFRNYIREKFQFIPKAFYLRIFLFLGISLGFGTGFFIDEILVGTILGIGIGLIVGGYFDKKNERRNRVL